VCLHICASGEHKLYGTLCGGLCRKASFTHTAVARGGEQCIILLLDHLSYDRAVNSGVIRPALQVVETGSEVVENSSKVVESSPEVVEKAFKVVEKQLEVVDWICRS